MLLINPIAGREIPWHKGVDEREDTERVREREDRPFAAFIVGSELNHCYLLLPALSHPLLHPLSFPFSFHILLSILGKISFHEPCPGICHGNDSLIRLALYMNARRNVAWEWSKGWMIFQISIRDSFPFFFYFSSRTTNDLLDCVYVFAFSLRIFI